MTTRPASQRTNPLYRWLSYVAAFAFAGAVVACAIHYVSAPHPRWLIAAGLFLMLSAAAGTYPWIWETSAEPQSDGY